MTEEQIDAMSAVGASSSLDFASSYERPTSTVPASPATTSTVPTSTAGTQATATTQPTATRTSPAQPTAEEVDSVVNLAKANLATANRVLDFRVDAATGLTIAMIRNATTGAVVQQIPGTDVIHLAQMLADWSPGKHMLLDLIA